MATTNHWGTYSSSIASWHIDFPAALWGRWPVLLAFADAVFEAGRNEDVLRVDDVPPASERGRNLFGCITPTALVGVFGDAGVEDRRLADLGAELLRLRPELHHVPHVPALAIDGPQFLDRSGPVYVSITTHTDIWFPRVVGINDDDDEHMWFDNLALARRHTPRLVRFLGAVRDAASALGGTWSHEAVTNINYTELVTDNGIAVP